MGKENQDYFKVGGRSGGPAGSLRRFKERFAQEQARTHRLEAGRLPHERRPAGARSPATIGGAGERPPLETPQETAETSSNADSTAETSFDTDSTKERRPVPDKEAQQALPRDSGPARGTAHASPAGETTAHHSPEESRAAPKEVSANQRAQRGSPPRPRFPEAGTAGFGPPASEEMAVGERAVRGGFAPKREAPPLLRAAARRFPLPFRAAAGLERVLDKRIRRALDESGFLSAVERKMRRPIARGLEMVQRLGETARDAQRAARH